MALDAGSIFTLLGARFSPSGFAAFDAANKRAIGSAKASEAAIASSSKRNAAAMSLMGSSAGKAGQAIKAGPVVALAGLGIVLATSASKAIKFEKKMSELQAVSGATGKQMGIMAKQALDLGQRTELGAVGATKAADALVELSKAGLSVSQISGGALKGALQLVAAGGLEAGDAAAYMSSALSIFNLRGKDATTVADALAHAANVTKADVSDFGQALAMGGSAAQTAGLSFKDTIRWLQQIVPAASSGSDAGTSLKTALVQLAKPTEKQAKLTKELGLNFFTQKGEMKSSAQVADMLQDKLGGMTRKQRLATLATLAGTDGFRALNVLYEKGTGTFARQGEAAKVGADKMKGAAGAIKTLKASWESVSIILGKELLPGIASGAEKLAGKLKEMSKDGSLKEFGKNMGDAIEGVGDILPVAVDGLNLLFDAANKTQEVFGSFGDALTGNFGPAMDLFLGFATTIIDGYAMIADAANAFDPLGLVPDDMGDKIRGISDQLNAVRERLRGEQEQLRMKIILEGDDTAQQKVDRLSKLKLEPKIMRILASGDLSAQQKVDAIQAIRLAPKILKVLSSGDLSTKQKVKALDALGISPKLVRILTTARAASVQVAAFKAVVAGVPPSKVAKIVADGALSAAGQVRALQAAIAGLQSKTVSIKTVLTTIKEEISLGSKKRGKASGRASGPKERALIGEGAGPEWWIDAATGQAAMTSGPMLADLGRDDYVIPTEPRYRGRALGLLAMLAGDLGAPGYKKGRPKKGGRFVPAKRDPLRLPVEDVERMRDTARDKWQKRADRVKTLEGDLKLKGKESAGQRAAARKKLPGARRDAAREKATYLQRKKEAAAAKRYAARIKEQEDLIEIARQGMDLADKKGDAPGYNRNLRNRRKALRALRKLLGDAQGHVPKGSPYWRELQKQILGANIDLTDIGDAEDEFGPKDTLLTPAEQKRQDALDAQLALAELTEPLGDDQAALKARVAFLTGVLGRVQKTGNNAFIAQAAQNLKGARDQLAGLTTAPSASPDLQAQLDQANRNREIAESDARASRAAVSAFGSSGDIGQGGQSAYGATVNVYTLHPGDPATLDAIGRASTAGIGLQATQVSSRESMVV